MSALDRLTLTIGLFGAGLGILMDRPVLAGLNLITTAVVVAIPERRAR